MYYIKQKLEFLDFQKKNTFKNPRTIPMRLFLSDQEKLPYTFKYLILERMVSNLLP